MPIQAGTYTKPKKETKTKIEKTDDDEPRQKREKKQTASVEVILAAGNVIGHLRKLLTYDMFKNRKDKADAELSIAELEAALKK